MKDGGGTLHLLALWMGPSPCPDLHLLLGMQGNVTEASLPSSPIPFALNSRGVMGNTGTPARARGDASHADILPTNVLCGHSSLGLHWGWGREVPRGLLKNSVNLKLILRHSY